MRSRIVEYRTFARRLSELLIFISALSSAVYPADAQITTNTALPVSSGGGIFRLQTKVLRSTGDKTGLNQELTVVIAPLVVVYGVTRKLAAFGVVPFLDKRIKFTGQNGRTERTTSGLADSRFFLRYTVYQKDVRGATLRIAPFAGAQIPTGSSNSSDGLGLLPRPFQLGSGSLSPFFGVVLTRQTFAWQVDVSTSYQLNNRSDRFRFGDVARFDVASKIRLLPGQLGDGLPSFLYANLESNVVWSGKNELGRTELNNSGGTVWYLDPGFQFISRQLIIETAVQIPVIQDLNGTALENDYIVVISARIAF